MPESIDVKAVPTTPVNDPEVVKPAATLTTEENRFDVSQHVYEGVKAAWGFGCGIPLAKPFLKAGEGIAGRVLNLTTGISLDKGDEEIKPKLADFDDAFINPAIARMFEALAPIISKTDETLRPMVMFMITKLYFIPYFPKETQSETAPEQ